MKEKGEEQTPVDEASATGPQRQRLVQELQIHKIELEMQNQELSRSRDEVEAERERYLDLFDFAPVGYFTLDRQGLIHEVNFAGASLLGPGRSILRERRFGNFVFETDRPVFNAFLDEVYGNRGKRCCEVSLVLEGEIRFHVRIEAALLGEGPECRVAVLDVTERKKYEEEVQRLHVEIERRSADHIAELEKANEELDSFGYTVSHELQTPLRAIDGLSRIILKRSGENFDEGSRSRFDIIRSSIQRMQRLIDELMAFSRLGRRPLNMAKLDMEEILQEAWQEQGIIHPGRSMTLRGKGLPPGIGDRGLIRQVVGNILSNAVKFAKPGEELLLEARGYAEGDKVIYAFKDNGIGFDMGYHLKLFGVFQRLHGPDEFPGTGVGLAIAQRIVTRHGGRIWAEAEVGKGATFFFSLPASMG